MVYCGVDQGAFSLDGLAPAPGEEAVREAVRCAALAWKSASAFPEATRRACEAALMSEPGASLEWTAAVVGWAHARGRGGRPMGVERARHVVAALLPLWRARGGSCADASPALTALCALDELARRAASAPACPPLPPREGDAAPFERVAIALDDDAEVRACAPALARLADAMQPPAVADDAGPVEAACLRSALLSRARQERPVTAALACLAPKPTRVFADWTSASESSAASAAPAAVAAAWKLQARYEEMSTVAPDALAALAPLPDIAAAATSSSSAEVVDDDDTDLDDLDDDDDGGDDDDEA